MQSLSDDTQSALLAISLHREKLNRGSKSVHQSLESKAPAASQNSTAILRPFHERKPLPHESATALNLS